LTTFVRYLPSPVCLFGLLGFALVVALADAADETSIRVSDVTLFGDMECFKIEAPYATYLYGKRGAGFASIIDRHGHDWISYRHGGRSAGEYRGLPKCGQPVKYFHCGYGFGQYTNDNWFTSTVTLRGPECPHPLGNQGRETEGNGTL
jgi:hypothetical protein